MYRVILAEDEELTRRGIIATVDWEAMGFTLADSAKDGGEAFERICALKPDLVVTDIRMPVLDGISLIRLVREEIPEAERPRFIVLTAHGDFDYAREAVRLDVEDFILKPLDDEELNRALGKVRSKLDRRSRDAAAEAVSDLGISPQVELPKGNDAQDHYAAEAVAEIHRCYACDLSLEDTASRLGISGGYLARVFRKKTGKTFFDYLTLTRMREAMALLANPTARIQEVAAAVGYADQRTFSQRFRQVVGCTPREYRQGKSGPRE